MPGRQKYVTYYGRRFLIPGRKFWLRVSLPPQIAALPHVVDLLNSLLMTPSEAVAKVAAQGDMEQLKVLLSREKFHVKPSGAICAAAEHGQCAALEVLLEKYKSDCSTKTDAALAAGRNGYVDVVEMILLRIKFENERSDVAWKVMEVAAENGHASVVHVTCQYAIENDSSHWISLAWGSKVLVHACASGYIDVVWVLLAQRRFRWDFATAFEVALANKQPRIVTYMHRALPTYLKELHGRHRENYDLLVHMARGGHLLSVEYLLKHGHDSLETVADAFYQAAMCEHYAIMNIFLDNELVTPNSFDATFERICHSGRFEAVVFLYNKKRVSTESVRRAFVSATTLEVAKFLYMNVDIPQDCINKLVVRSVQCEDSKKSERIDCQILRASIVEFFYGENVINLDDTFKVAASCNNVRCIDVFCMHVSPECVANVLSSAAENDSYDVIRLMWKRRCVTWDAMMQGLISAATTGSTRVLDFILSIRTITSNIIVQVIRNAAHTVQRSVVQLLYQKHRTSWKCMVDLFQESLRNGDTQMISLLIGIPCISRSAKNEALLSVVQQNRLDVVECMIKLGYWPRYKLLEALRIATHPEMKAILREKLSRDSHLNSC